MPTQGRVSISFRIHFYLQAIGLSLLILLEVKNRPRKRMDSRSDLWLFVELNRGEFTKDFRLNYKTVDNSDRLISSTSFLSRVSVDVAELIDLSSVMHVFAVPKQTYGEIATVTELLLTIPLTAIVRGNSPAGRPWGSLIVVSLSLTGSISAIAHRYGPEQSTANNISVATQEQNTGCCSHRERGASKSSRYTNLGA